MAKSEIIFVCSPDRGKKAEKIKIREENEDQKKY